ncbi:MAG: class I SAM-dependent methyltransferase [Candidatus Hydrogenedentes bacterium]|nr:class I SAM-dependent methyltransferase [Candidatus Hydrogenedentota bacterium]
MNQSDPPQIPEDWYSQSFGALYPVIYAHRTVEAAGPEAEFAAQCLDLRGGQRVLDIGCGNGRHILHLLRKTPRVAGLDYSPDLLAMARSLVGGGAWLIRGDMRRLPLLPAFNAVTNFFTSFGYFKTTAEDLAVLHEMARVLLPKGRFFIDHVNPAYVKNTLVPQSDREYKGYAIRERRWIDQARRRVNKIIEASLGGEAAGTWFESVRLYGEAELRELINQAGLQVRSVYGDYDGARMSDRRPRMIVVGEKR